MNYVGSKLMSSQSNQNATGPAAVLVKKENIALDTLPDVADADFALVRSPALYKWRTSHAGIHLTTSNEQSLTGARAARL